MAKKSDPDDINLRKLVAAMPEDWRKKLRKGLHQVRARDPGLGMILKAEIEKLGREIEAQKKTPAKTPPPNARKKAVK